ncbi:MAG: HAMP domain-containing sensor histidine kinase [Ilumatobacteraceae bacterium]
MTPSPWRRLPSIGLRNRILITFGAGALLLSVILAFTTYGITKSNLVKQRETASITQAYINARRVQRDLIIDPTNVGETLAHLDSPDRLLLFRNAWGSTSPIFGPNQIPPLLQTRVIEDLVASRMIIKYRGSSALIIGIPLPQIQASYFEINSLSEVSSALRSVRLALLLATIFTTIVGIGLGAFASRRVVRPLASAALAARAIADGRLDTRLGQTDDPDLQLLTNAFNDMVVALQQRVERDARFASDVSHELRSPLMTLSASAEVMLARRDELPERSKVALDLLVGDVIRFQGLVEDLLEISRFDAGAVRLLKENLVLNEFVRQAVSVSSLPNTDIICDPELQDVVIRGDRRRLARVMANLIDNARLHSGGKASIIISHAEPLDDLDESTGSVWIIVQDDGEGLVEGELELIFERFSRGGAAGKRGASEGAGLGLALAREHVTLHGGRVWAEHRGDGISGARFIVELPRESRSGVITV